jgi:effector-binding domain-containing protein
MEHEVNVGRREATFVMSSRRPVRLSEIGSVIGVAFGEIYGYLGARGGEPQGPPFVIYHGMPQADEPFDVEICAPVARAMDAPSGWRVRELPAGTFATLLHIGPYDTVAAAHGALTAWLGAHDFVVTGPPREVYLSPGDTPPEQIRTIVELPVAHAPTLVATT